MHGEVNPCMNVRSAYKGIKEVLGDKRTSAIRNTLAYLLALNPFSFCTKNDSRTSAHW